MSQRTESFFIGPSNTRFFYQSWEATNPKAHLVITHGHGEHSSSYERVVDALKDMDISVYAWDLRGHGRSEGQRGYARTFEDYIKDFESFLQHLKHEKNLYPENLVLLGHSMGALIQLMTLLANSHWYFRAQVVSSPMLGVALQVPIIKDIAAFVLSNVWPQLTLGNEIKNTDLSSDPEVLKEFEKDVLRHHRISSGVYLGAITCIEALRSRIQTIKLPTLWQMPENDPVVGCENSRSMFNKLGSSQKFLFEYPNRRHEIYNDVGREQVFDDLRFFLKNLK